MKLINTNTKFDFNMHTDRFELMCGANALSDADDNEHKSECSKEGECSDNDDENEVPKEERLLVFTERIVLLLRVTQVALERWLQL